MSVNDFRERVNEVMNKHRPDKELEIRNAALESFGKDSYAYKIMSALGTYFAVSDYNIAISEENFETVLNNFQTLKDNNVFTGNIIILTSEEDLLANQSILIASYPDAKIVKIINIEIDGLYTLHIQVFSDETFPEYTEIAFQKNSKGKIEEINE